MSEIVSSLPDDYFTGERAIPHRETVLHLALEMYVRRYGSDTLLDLVRLNSLLATTGQPLASQTEIDVLYGETLPVRQRN